MKKNDTRRYRYSLHGDIKIDTRSNRLPRNAVSYSYERVRTGGRVWCVHKDGTTSWLCDTVLFETAKRMVADFATD
jgi:hypothetical protein